MIILIYLRKKRHLKKKIKVILGELDKITPTSELEAIFKDSNLIHDLSIVDCMDHECGEDEEIESINSNIQEFLRSD